MAIVEAIIFEQVETQADQAFRIIASSSHTGINRDMALSYLLDGELGIVDKG